MTATIDATKVQLAEQASIDTPPSGFGAYYTGTDGKPYHENDAGTVTDLSAAAAAAPNNATYITQTANGSLSAEQALSALATGLLKNTTTTGVLSIATLTTITTYARYLVHDETLGSNGAFDVTLTDIDSPIQAETGDMLELRISLRGAVSAASDAVYIMWNNDTTVTNYRAVAQATADTGVTDAAADVPSAGITPAATADANEFGQFHVLVPFYGGSHRKVAQVRSDLRSSSTAIEHRDTAHHWENTAAITRVMVRTDNHATDLFATGSRLQIIVHKAQALATGAFT
jgi:hypothetical protein